MGKIGGKAGKLGLLVIGVCGWVIGYFATFDLLKKFFETSGYEGIIAVLYVILLCTILIVICIWREFSQSRKARYSKVLEKLHNITHQIRDLQSFILHVAQAQTTAQVDTYIGSCKAKLRTILDESKTCFEIVSSANVRATIKIISTHENKLLYVDTLVRDTSSTNRYFELDNRRVRDGTDPLDKNPEFKTLFSQETDRWHYLSNDLRSEPEFYTTSVDAYKGAEARKVYQGTAISRLQGRGWPLPYRSTLTCAIRQRPLDDCPGQPEAVGFLCFDSLSKNVFLKGADVQLAFAIADALYHPLSNMLATMAGTEEPKVAKAIS